MIIFSLIGVAVIVIVLVDAFETIILPRRVNRRIRFSRLFYRIFWRIWKKGKKLYKSGNDTKAYLGVFGPLSLIILLSIWAIALIFGFALINFGVQTDIASPHGARDFITYLYLSGGTFFPVELVDTYTLQDPGKFLAIIEGGMGFGFLAIIIGYLPVLYQAFSKREVNINLLDSYAGSPPSALYFLQQFSKGNNIDELKPQLEKWEGWCAELLETHLSYPVLAYYRSQHDDQSWIAALTMILDTSTIILVSKNDSLHTYAKSTFAIARHAAVDLTQAYYLNPQNFPQDKLSKKDIFTLRKLLKESDFSIREGEKNEEKLLFLRNLYEPYIHALSDFFLMSITPLVTERKIEEAWRKNI